MVTWKQWLLGCTITALALLGGTTAPAAELGDFCWTTETGNLLRFSISEAGAGHYTYTGMFVDSDGAAFAVIGHVESVGGELVGSFSGAKTAADEFKTAIYRVTLDPATLSGSGEGIRQKYNRSTAAISTDYRTHTLTPTACP
ncbi:MAG: hypothetical protein ACOY3Z_04485 [Thermodesulfobacteriota bacterium]